MLPGKACLHGFRSVPMADVMKCACPLCHCIVAIPSAIAPNKRLQCPHCQQLFFMPGVEAATLPLEPAPAVTKTSPPAPAEVEPQTASLNQNPEHATRTLNDQHVTTAEKSFTSTPTTGPQKIGRFEVRRWLGEGAFGDVYEAYDPQLDRAVAIKVAKVGRGDSSQHIKRFLREAKAAAGLRHPHIVPVHEFGQEGDNFHIVSAFIQGQTLQPDLGQRKQKSE